MEGLEVFSAIFPLFPLDAREDLFHSPPGFCFQFSLYGVAMSLTNIQSEILVFIKNSLERRGVAPSTSEICSKFGFKSFGTVARHMKRLEEKGYLRRAGRRNKQGVTLLDQPRALNVSLVGTVAAGLPIEAVHGHEANFAVPEHLIGPGEHFALKVKGQSMVEDGICDGDVILVRRQSQANNGETVVALVDNEATVKRFYHDKSDKVELRPANSGMQSIWISGKNLKNLMIQGVVVGLFRQYA
jgi:repressor LexA